MNEKLKQYLVPASLAGTVVSAFPSFAEGPTSAVSATDWAPVLSSLTGQITVSNIVAALATFVTAGIGLVFMWWGVRKLTRTVMGAFRRGKLSV